LLTQSGMIGFFLCLKINICAIYCTLYLNFSLTSLYFYLNITLIFVNIVCLYQLKIIDLQHQNLYSMETKNKRIYKVIVKNSQNKIEEMHTFTMLDNALICFSEFHYRFAHYYKISIESIQI
jgi:hypothetical protein